MHSDTDWRTPVLYTTVAEIPPGSRPPRRPFPTFLTSPRAPRAYNPLLIPGPRTRNKPRPLIPTEGEAAVKSTLLPALVALAFVASPALADTPSFRKSKDRDTEEFVTKVGEAIVKAARSNPKDIELIKYS